MLSKALDTATPTLRDLAARTKVSYHAVRQYRLGARAPSPRILRQLARVLRDQAARITKAAQRLERQADDLENH